MKQRVLLILCIAGLVSWAGVASAQDDEGADGAEEQPAETAETGDEQPPAEETPAAEAPAEEAEEAPAEETAEAEEAPAEEAEEDAETAAAEEEAPAEESTDEAAAGEQEGEEGEEGEEPKEKPFRRTFAGTSLYWNNAFTAISLDKGHDYAWNPSYTMMWGLAPNWNVTDSLSLSTNIGFMTELTNSDYANKRGEVFFNDIPINLSYRYSVDINDDVKFGTGLSLGGLLPTSKMSQYVTLYTALSIGTSASFTFPNVLQGLTLAWRPSFKKYFHASENPKPKSNKLDESKIPDTEKAQSDHYLALAYAGNENPSWRISNGLSLSLGIWQTLSFTFSYGHGYTYKYSPKNADIDEGLDCDVLPQGCDSIRDTGHNERGIYSQSFGYNFGYVLPKPVHMLSLSLGAETATNQLAPDGQYRTPFFNRETLITFGIGIDLDSTVTAIQGGGETPEEEEEE